jgi:abortive infection bacteriophage resistance protein
MNKETIHDNTSGETSWDEYIKKIKEEIIDEKDTYVRLHKKNLRAKLCKMRLDGVITFDEYLELLSLVQKRDKVRMKNWLSTFNTDSATECFTAVQRLKEKINDK